MRHLTTLISFILVSSIYGKCQIQNFYNYLESNLKSYDLAGFYFVKTPNNIPPEGFFDIYKLQSGDIDNDISLIKSWTDPQLQMTHFRYQQTYKGILIEAAEITEHFDSENLIIVNGKLADLSNQNIEPQISPEEAIAIAQNCFSNSINNERDLTSDFESSSIIILRDPYLFFSLDNYDNLSATIDGSKYTLCWKIELFNNQDQTNRDFFVNVINGSVHRNDNRNQYGHANIHYHGNKYIDTQWVGGFKQKYYTWATDNNRDISTKYYNGQSYVNGFDKDDNWGWNENEATTPHWFVTQSWDYFFSTFGRLGMDGNGGRVNVWAEKNNGPSQYIYSNNSDNIYLSNIFGNEGFAIDFVAHEYTHGINRHTANLQRKWEPGALNESFSDIFGFMIESYAEGGYSDWTIGEDPNLPMLRSLSNPKSAGMHYSGLCNEIPGQPNTYHGQYWEFQGCGNGNGMHVNSGVQNYWFYLLANGGNGTNDNNDNYNINGIGINDAAWISYLNLTFFMQTGSQYADARAGSIAAAQILFGICSQQEIQTTNAWHAVGVGLQSNCTSTSTTNIDKKTNLSIYPNPASDDLIISSINTKIDQISILSIKGETLFKSREFNDTNLKLDISFLTNGVYVVEIKTKLKTVYKKLIVH